MKIGSKIYFHKNTGCSILIKCDAIGDIRNTSMEEDYNFYTKLKKFKIDEIGLIQLEYGEYEKLSKGFNSARVNLETKKLEFFNRDIPVVEQEPSKEEKRIQELENQVLLLENEKLGGIL
ncbi:hypothetical protein CHF27_011255 [Romboutsia maritimum]|uniref:Uncharacterized protein n=1 Tax=Romboutsia maritimum TaxID=2020948 RepID=A0A371IQY3_9FIRM|nr:hypothetical protein [Romboutsia maritimum]RDY22889.1 hypothetical protein CHF27_011255 [Romboutsia maritimum]